MHIRKRFPDWWQKISGEEPAFSAWPPEYGDFLRYLRIPARAG
jgi:hypothetical protein